MIKNFNFLFQLILILFSSNVDGEDVIGGSPIAIGQVPWQVSIETGGPGNWHHHCGGVIIDDEYILTAAHCTYSAPGVPYFPSQMRIRVGTQSINGGGVIRNVTEIIHYNCYQSTIRGYDVTVLKLDSPLDFSSPNINSIDIGNFHPSTGTQVNFSGYGQGSGGSLHYGNRMVVPWSQTGVPTGNVANFNTQIPLGANSGLGVTGGMDSGGPGWIMNGNTPILVGLVSWIYPVSGQNSELNSPTFFADVTSVKDWIQNIINGNSATQECCGNGFLVDGATTTELEKELINGGGPAIVVEGLLTIDRDAFLGGVKLYMMEGARIQINSDVVFDMNGGSISSQCDEDPWSYVNVNGTAIFYDVDISGGQNSIIFSYGSSGSVSFSTISDCTYGISLVQSGEVSLYENDIDADVYGVLAKSSMLIATSNRVGLNSSLYRGIWLESGADGIIEDNTVNADYHCISVNYSYAVVNSNIVTMNGGFSFDAGIWSFASNVVASSNEVSGSGYSGIYLIGNNGSMMSYNTVDGSYDRAVLLQGSQDQYLLENDINGSSYAGIYNLNSSDNMYECNAIEAGDYGLYNGSGSANQMILTNVFEDASTDFYTNSNMSKQSFHGNSDWKYAEASSSIDLQIHHFEVSDEQDYGGEVPNSWVPVELFKEPADVESPASCSMIGPGGAPSTEFICWWVDYLQNLPEDKQKFFWINTYHIIKNYKSKVPEADWPLCLIIFCEVLEECGIFLLVESEVAYAKALEGYGDELKELKSDMNYSELESQEEKAGFRIAAASFNVDKQAQLKQLRVEQTETLNEIECANEMFDLWSSVYLLRLKHQDEQLTEGELEHLSEVSSLCASEYGDVVHWARGLLSAYTMELPPSNDECLDKVAPRSRSMQQAVSLGELYPNPAKDEVSITLNGYEVSTLVIKSIDGRVLKKIALSPGLNRLETSELSEGLYLLDLENSIDLEKVKKLIIIK